MKHIVKFSLKNTFVIFLLVFVLISGGIYSTMNMQQEFYPSMNVPYVFVTGIYPGATSREISEKIENPLQKAMSSVEGVKQIRATSNENYVTLTAEFPYSCDIEKVKKQVEDVVNNVKLPEKALKPKISTFSVGGGEFAEYSLKTTKSKDDLKKYIDETLKPELSRIQGISEIAVSGISNSDVYVTLNLDKLKEKGLTIDKIKPMLEANNLSYPTGSLNVDNKNLPIRVEKKITSIDDIKSLPIIIPPNQSKMFGDIIKQASAGMNSLANGLGQVAQGTASIGELTGGNTESIATLAQIQAVKMQLDSDLAILNKFQANPKDTSLKPEQVAAASKDAVASKEKLEALSTSLSNNLNNQAKKFSELQAKASEMQKSQSSKASNSSAVSTNGTEPKIEIAFLSDIANVELKSGESDSYVRSDGKDALILGISKTPAANQVEISKKTEDLLKKLHDQDNSISFQKIFDMSTYVKSSINNMLKEGVIGTIFAILVIAIFLKDIRATVIAVISIPLSVLTALIILPRLNISINLMSLSGIAVAVGRIVDDSIVVIENIYRRASLKGKADTELIESGTSEVARAITSSTITTIAVFLPLSFISGQIGAFFKAFAYTVIICLVVSLLVALTVVPAMSKVMLTRRKRIKENNHDGKIANTYKRLLEKCLKHRLITIFVSIVLLAVSIFTVTKVGLQYLPKETPNSLSGNLAMPAGTDAKTTNEEIKKFEKDMLSRNDIESVSVTVGSIENSNGTKSASNSAGFVIVLKDNSDRDKASTEIMDKVRAMSSDGKKYSINPISLLGGNSMNGFSVNIRGKSEEDINKSAMLVVDKLKTIEELKNIQNNLENSKPEISIKVDANKAAEKGLLTYQVATSVQELLSYNTVTTFKNNDKDVSVYLGISKDNLKSLDNVKNIEIASPMGENIKLSDIADVSVINGPVSIKQLNGELYTSITADINSEDIQKISSKAYKEIDSIKSSFPKGVDYLQGGASEELNTSFKEMMVAILVAVVLVYIIMVLAFGEAKAPFAILFSLPFAAAGAFLALFISRNALSMVGLIGLLMLIGIVVTNAIVLLDKVGNNRKEGMTVHEALINAGMVRLRPIFMTAIATIMALIPQAANLLGEKTMYQNMAIVVIGGLTLSTLLTLIIVPVIYSLIERDKRLPQDNDVNELIALGKE
ncbi:hydrophobic/amphiphilic exporter-1, HAE1 family [Clostridium cavendishii DSM 21758]|uniref:Hydrophobic/amphiphilic exporter-1, HAE1 family n=1 Tax=Clostridium cavendishii DSM 21758 TaxID=1121302 RepID=A0A1M6MFF5_9CLOT|nr:efflux RND transporter permease subunit [Clostridium cavendishii]SHJ82093.1 hydrophobic/amphiphilic exporter-1, HAE1 family [Clostridium cavendishii DSM 21758]